MTLPSQDIEKAFVILRELSPSRGVKERIYQDIAFTQKRHSLWFGRWATALAILLGGSTALALGGVGWAVFPRVANSLGLSTAVKTSSDAATGLQYSKGVKRVSPRIGSNNGAPQPSVDVSAQENFSSSQAVDFDEQLTNDSAQSPSGRGRGQQTKDLKNEVFSKRAERSRGLPEPSQENVATEGLLAHNSRETQATASELRLQLEDYQEAVSHLSSDPTRALRAFDAFRSKWPRSAIMPEVEFRRVQALSALGRDAEAKSEARAYVVRYPGSSKNKLLDALVGN